MIKIALALVFAIPTYGLSIVALIAYVFLKGRYFSKTHNPEAAGASQRSGGLIKTGDEYYIGELARIENQIKNNEDFYGHWLDAERATLVSDTRLAIPNVILGLIYMKGIHVNVNLEKAEEYFSTSIKLGSPFAYKYLAVIENMRDNKSKANEHIEKAVALGDPEAMVMLGVYYVHEITLEGGQPDYNRARSLFQKAARMGHDVAIKNLEIMDARGV